MGAVCGNAVLPEISSAASFTLDQGNPWHQPRPPWGGGVGVLLGERLEMETSLSPGLILGSRKG